MSKMSELDLPPLRQQLSLLAPQRRSALLPALHVAMSLYGHIPRIVAAEIGIAPGDAVRVASRRGQGVLRAQVNPKINLGVVFIPFHFAKVVANLLTIDTLVPQALIPEFKTCAVKLCPARLEELPEPEAHQPRGRK